MVTRIFGLLSCVAVAGEAAAQCVTYHAPAAKAVVVRKEVVVEKVVVPVVAPVAVYAPVPVYSAVYVPPALGHAPPPHAPPAVTSPGELQQVLAAIQGVHGKVDAIDARLRAVEGKAGAAPQPQPPTPAPPAKADPFAPRPADKAGVEAPRPPSPAAAALALFKGRCASCHDAGVAAEKGGGLALTEGGALSKLDDRQARKLLTATYAGRMPPASSGVAKLTDEEVALVVAFVESLK